MEHALHFQCKLKSYSLIFPAAQQCPSELINEICHHAKPLCLTTFPKIPQLFAPRCSPTSTQTVNIHTHAVINPYRIERTFTRTIRLTARQTLTCLQRALQRDFFSPSSFLFRLNEQARLSRSLYSWADSCVSVCFNLNGFQVPSLSKSASSFSPLIQQLTLKLPSSPPLCSLPLFLTFPSTLRRHLSVPSITLSSSLLPLPFLSLLFFFLRLSSTREETRAGKPLNLTVQSGG